MRRGVLVLLMCAAPFAVPVNGVFASETSNIPVPKQRPSVLEMERSRSKQQASSGLPDEERVCRSRLKRLGVRFSPVKRISGKGGCGIRYPIELSRLPGGVKLSGRTILNCSAGEALAKWTSESAAPAAKRIYGSKLVRIDQFASYACRSRNSKNGAKLSEHAKGSAVDLGRFILADGTTVEVGFPGPTALRRKRFLKKLRDAGCRFFTTVLGPGSDAYHKDHFHFDLAQRRRGYRYCR